MKTNKKSLFTKRRIITIGVGALLLGSVSYMAFGGSNGNAKKNYITVNINQGDLSYTVSATGEIQPVSTVNVGSQVSGTISEIFVDYNSQVKKGDILLKIDPSVLQSSVD